jgi:hypothetical protein
MSRPIVTIFRESGENMTRVIAAVWPDKTHRKEPSFAFQTRAV